MLGNETYLDYLRKETELISEHILELINKIDILRELSTSKPAYFKEEE